MEVPMRIPVERVTFYRLRPGSDRRGPLASFAVRSAPNQEHIFQWVMNWLGAIMAGVVGELPTRKFSDWGFLLRHRQDEYADAFISIRSGAAEVPQIGIDHKYWNDKQIECFMAVVGAYAKLYDIDVVWDGGGEGVE